MSFSSPGRVVVSEAVGVAIAIGITAGSAGHIPAVHVISVCRASCVGNRCG